MAQPQIHSKGCGGRDPLRPDRISGATLVSIHFHVYQRTHALASIYANAHSQERKNKQCRTCDARTHTLRTNTGPHVHLISLRPAWLSCQRIWNPSAKWGRHTAAKAPLTSSHTTNKINCKRQTADRVAVRRPLESSLHLCPDSSLPPVMRAGTLHFVTNKEPPLSQPT